jgi:uracil-DNA glycosylase family 4
MSQGRIINKSQIEKLAPKPCETCPFPSGRKVGGRGPVDAPVVIVGEGPGMEELMQGIPFIGPSGEVVERARIPYLRIPTYFTNATQCTFQKTKNTTQDQRKLEALCRRCNKRLIDEIQAHPRKVIIALGAAALWSLTGDYTKKITQVRGQLFPKPELAEVGIVAALHPAFLLRGGGSWPQFKDDISYAFRLAEDATPKTWTPPTWEVIESPDRLREVAEEIRGRIADLDGGRLDIAADNETGGFDHRTEEILSFGFTLDGNHVYLVPEALLAAEEVRWMLEEPQINWIWHNGKFDIKFFRSLDIPGKFKSVLCKPIKARVDEDTMLLSYALNEKRGYHDLEQIAGNLLASPDWKGELDKYKRKWESYRVIPKPVLYKYQAYDIANTYRIYAVLRPQVEADKNSRKQYLETLIPASEALAKVELNGIAIDPQRVEKNGEELLEQCNAFSAAINDIALAKTGKTLNVNSPLQLSSFLFDVLGFKPPRGNRGTGAEVLDELPPEHPVVANLKKYRKVAKLRSTYVVPFKPYVNGFRPTKSDKKNGVISSDGRVHASYLLHGTATGRLASRDPNMQNIPRGPLIRSQFVAPPGRRFLELDLNQAELRSLACLSGDPELCAIYLNGAESLHDVVRREIFGDPHEWSLADIDAWTQRWGHKWKWQDPKFDLNTEIKGEQKMIAKNVNFGIVYGITAFGLAEQIEDAATVAQQMLDAWARKFPVAWGFISKCKDAPSRGQNLVTVFGYRKRHGIVSDGIHKDLQNQAANFPHQSTAATITLHGVIRLIDPMKENYDIDIVNTVHDSIIMECPDDPALVMEAARWGISELEQIPVDYGITRIPFVAEGKTGLDWGALTDLHKVWPEWKEAA